MEDIVIKWKRLYDITEKIIKEEGRNKPFYLRFGIDHTNIMGRIVERKKDIDIYINLALNKDLATLIETFAHELAHFKLASGVHTEEHEKKTRELEERIRKYYEGGKDEKDRE